jgi:diguanylate cyclase (GGDEF)-like protein
VNTDKKKPDNLRRELARARRELDILYEIGNAMRTTLNLDQVLYIILTAVTSGEGLGFNRAMLLLVNEKDNTLEGKMGLGPDSGEEAARIWKGIENQKMTLEDLISAYTRFKSSPDNQLNIKVKNIKIPLREEEGVLAMTALEDMPFEITNREDLKKSVNDTLIKMLELENFVSVPLKAKDRVLGVLLVDNIFTKRTITKSDLRVLRMFANHAGLAIENSRLYEETVHLSRIDWLTGLWNYGYFAENLKRLIKNCLDSESELSFLMIDMDNFKLFNDTYGHVKGDEALKTFAQILKEKTRRKDFVARYGGEEFCVIMPGTKKTDAFIIADRIRGEAVTKFAESAMKDNMSLTVSIGIACAPFDDTKPQELIKKADTAMYKAKELGKNKVVMYGPDT